MTKEYCEKDVDVEKNLEERLGAVDQTALLQVWLLRHRSERPNFDTLPRITLNWGMTLSIQVGRGLYCTPRDEFGPWTHVEIGFPNRKLPSEFGEYTDGTGDVFAYVPIEMVGKLFYNNGGMKDGVA